MRAKVNEFFRIHKIDQSKISVQKKYKNDKE